MNKVIAYVGPGFSELELQIITKTLRMQHISTTVDKALATVIIVPNDIKSKQQNIDEIICQKFHIPEVLPEIVIPETKKYRKKTFTTNQVIKRFNTTKQNFKRNFLTRTHCK